MIAEGIVPTRVWDVSPGRNGARMHGMVEYCSVCQSATLPAGPRQNEGHLGVRFGRDDTRHFSVYEGEIKHLGAYEVQAGPGGWVLEAVPDAPCCSCGTYGRMVRLRYGDDFRIVRDMMDGGE